MVSAAVKSGRFGSAVDEDTAERRAILKKVGPIFLAVIDGGGNRDVLSEEPCVLGASGVRSIP